IRIEIPRGGYVPVYTRQPEPAPVVVEAGPPAVPVTVVAVPVSASLPVEVPARRPWRIVAAALAGPAPGAAARAPPPPPPRPPAILKEAWGPLADPSGELLVVVATNMHMLVRPHIAPHPLRLPAPDEAYRFYGPNRPLPPGSPLYMEPA